VERLHHPGSRGRLRRRRVDILARDTTGSLWLYRGNGDRPGRWANPGLNRVGGDDRPGHPRNWDRAAGNDLLARDVAGALWLYPGNNAGSLGLPRQIGNGWSSYTYIG
jgi:hypothetical protein